MHCGNLRPGSTVLRFSDKVVPSTYLFSPPHAVCCGGFCRLTDFPTWLSDYRFGFRLIVFTFCSRGCAYKRAASLLADLMSRPFGQTTDLFQTDLPIMLRVSNTSRLLSKWFVGSGTGFGPMLLLVIGWHGLHKRELPFLSTSRDICVKAMRTIYIRIFFFLREGGHFTLLSLKKFRRLRRGPSIAF